VVVRPLVAGVHAQADKRAVASACGLSAAPRRPSTASRLPATYASVSCTCDCEESGAARRESALNGLNGPADAVVRVRTGLPHASAGGLESRPAITCQQDSRRTSAAGRMRRRGVVGSNRLVWLDTPPGTPARPKWPHIKLPEHAWDAGNTRGQARAILAAVEIPSRDL